MDVLTCHCHPLWRELWLFLWIWCNLLAGEELSLSYPRAFLSMGFLKVFVLEAEVSFPISSGCSCSWSWRHPLTFSLLPGTALQFAFPQRPAWPEISVYPMAAAALLCETIALHVLLSPIPLNLFSPFSEDYVGLIWPQRPTLGCQVVGTPGCRDIDERTSCPICSAQLLKRHAVFEETRGGGGAKVSRPILLCPSGYKLANSGVLERLLTCVTSHTDMEVS